MELINRPRRLRANPSIRKMVRETRLSKAALIYPICVEEGCGIVTPIPSLEGQTRYSPDTLHLELEKVRKAGVPAVLLFGIPAHKDQYGSSAWAENGVVQQALRAAKRDFPDLYLITDVCNMGVKSLSRYLNQYEAAEEKAKDIAKRLIGLESHLAQDVQPYL